MPGLRGIESNLGDFENLGFLPSFSALAKIKKLVGAPPVILFTPIWLKSLGSYAPAPGIFLGML